MILYCISKSPNNKLSRDNSLRHKISIDTSMFSLEVRSPVSVVTLSMSVARGWSFVICSFHISPSVPLTVRKMLDSVIQMSCKGSWFKIHEDSLSAFSVQCEIKTTCWTTWKITNKLSKLKVLIILCLVFSLFNTYLLELGWFEVKHIICKKKLLQTKDSPPMLLTVCYNHSLTVCLFVNC